MIYWLKFRHKFSSGCGEWEYKYLGEITSKENEAKEYVKDEILSSIIGIYSYSEHYRGVDWEIVDQAPKEIVEKLIKESESIISYRTNLVKKLEGIKRY